MSDRERDLTHRRPLGFARAAEEAFRFLSDHGFRLQGSDVTILRYVSEGVFLNVYQGRSSYELGVEVGPLQSGDRAVQGYSIESFVRLMNPLEAANLLCFTATTPS